MVVAREVYTRSILVKSKLPGVDYVVNPYGGCSHGCVYCYAIFMKRFHKKSEGWGEYLDVKVNGPEVLLRDISRIKGRKWGKVMLSSVCDPYIPEEAKYCLTKRLLTILLNHEFSVSILTKSSLVTRDIDLIKAFEDIEVGFTITGLEEKARRILEPRASPHKKRIDALRTLRKAGISTWAFVGPVLPGLTDLEGAFRDLEGLVDQVLIDKLNLRKGSWDRLDPVLAKNFPRLSGVYEAIYRGDNSIWNDMYFQANDLAKRYGIKIRHAYD
jgi:DNA repair photolyase